MLESTQDIIKLITTIIACTGAIVALRQAKREHPVFHYDQNSSANEVDWRWRKPDAQLGLKLEDDEQKSCLHIPVQLSWIEKGCAVAGYLCAAFVLYMYGVLFMRDAGWPDYMISGIFIILSLALLRTSGRVSSIALYPEHLVIIEPYAFILKRTITYKHDPHLKFKGELMTVSDFKFYIRRRCFYIFTPKRTFLMSLNQSQGSWLVGGLEYWFNHAVLPQKIK